MKLAHETTDIDGLHAAFCPALFRLDNLWRSLVGHELHIVHGLDGVHSLTSRHYQGCAVDIRTWVDPEDGSSGQIEGEKRIELQIATEGTLGGAFMVLDEGSHFHISLKPRGKSWKKF